MIWQYDTPEAIVQCVASTDNINSIPEVLAGTQNSENVYSFNGNNGSVLWQYFPRSGVIAVLFIEDINGDMIPDILVAPGNDTLFCIKGSSDSALTLWILPLSDIDYLDEISDVNNDSVHEVVVGTWKGGYVYCLGGKNGTPIWSYAGQDTSVYGSIMGITGIKDVNGDEFDDVVAAIYTGELWCLSGKVYGVEENNDKCLMLNAKLEAEPNPFIRTTSIKYKVQGSELKDYKIRIYDIAGKLVEETKDNVVTAEAGCSIGKNLKTGVYFVKVNNYKPIKVVKMGGIK